MASSDQIQAVGQNWTNYFDTAQTVNLQTVTVRSISVPVSSVLSIEVYANALTSGADKSGFLSGEVAIARGAGNVFLSGTVSTSTISTIPGLLMKILANTGTNAADIQVVGSATNTVNWRVWSNVRA